MNFIRSGRFGLSLVVMLGLGCHSAQLRSPTDPQLAIHSQWLKEYKEARETRMSNPARSCELFKALGNDTKFPAHQLASLRAWEVCEAQTGPNLIRESLPPWLEEMSLDVALQLASKSGDKAAEMELATEKSKQNCPKAKS
ncbi:MAG: hypothetical protein HC883_05590 [Bdellovibrionaceae bacterium]|nr:hypothetical protein [Pseudobdellovibrionaceae bacterium]